MITYRGMIPPGEPDDLDDSGDFNALPSSPDTLQGACAYAQDDQVTKTLRDIIDDLLFQYY